MHLYKDGMVCYADKDQVELFIADGWSNEKPVEEEVIEEEVIEEEVIEEEVDETESEVDSVPAGRKITRKKG